MKLRETVTRLDRLPSTDRECSQCEDGTYVKDGYELICDTCQYTPTRETHLREKTTAWERHRKQVDARASGQRDGRPRLVGGYEDAYWGEGAYSFSPGEGFQF